MRKEKYHITIKNNETDQVIHDSDACAIIGSINSGAETAECVLVESTGQQLYAAIKHAETAVAYAREML